MYELNELPPQLPLVKPYEFVKELHPAYADVEPISVSVSAVTST